jgi:membrane protein DedA with SNARE-associated domain
LQLARVQTSSKSLTEVSMSIFIWVAIVLFIAWILGFTLFHVASALIHILLIAAIVALILHFMRGVRRTA